MGNLMAEQMDEMLFVWKVALTVGNWDLLTVVRSVQNTAAKLGKMSVISSVE